jgi:two-component sensor histidine kinase
MTWRVDARDGQRRLVLNWRETGGPAVTAPAHRGFGSRLIELGLAGELGGGVRFDFPAEGAACHIDLPLPDAE